MIICPTKKRKMDLVRWHFKINTSGTNSLTRCIVYLSAKNTNIKKIKKKSIYLFKWKEGKFKCNERRLCCTLHISFVMQLPAHFTKFMFWNISFPPAIEKIFEVYFSMLFCCFVIICTTRIYFENTIIK